MTLFDRPGLARRRGLDRTPRRVTDFRPPLPLRSLHGRTPHRHTNRGRPPAFPATETESARPATTPPGGTPSEFGLPVARARHLDAIYPQHEFGNWIRLDDEARTGLIELRLATFNYPSLQRMTDPKYRAIAEKHSGPRGRCAGVWLTARIGWTLRSICTASPAGASGHRTGPAGWARGRRRRPPYGTG